MYYHTKFRRFLAMALIIVITQGMLSISATAQTVSPSLLSDDLDVPLTLFGMELMGTLPEANVTTEAELKTFIESGQTAILGANITLTAPLLVPLGKTAILDLNGFTIDRGLTGGTAVLNGNVITVNGSLTLEDSQGGGKITGGKKGGYIGGGGVNVTGGTLTMNSGSISGNTANGYGGGVYVTSGGAFNMNGGVVSDNESGGHGGGVFIEGSSFMMSSGTISDNTAVYDGGGVYVIDVDSTFIMDNGTISGNTATGDKGCFGNGGGVAVVMGGVFTMNNGNISGNTAVHYGGGAYAFIGGVIVMNAGIVSSNNAYCGGGIYFDESVNLTYGVGTLTINGGEVCSNTTVTGDGGGIYVANGAFSMSSCKVYKNSALKGAGVFSLGGTCIMENSEISENNSFEDIMGHGGGMYISGGTFIMKNSRVIKNSAVCGGGIYASGGSFTMESGQINENSTYGLGSDMSDGGGVYMNAGSIFAMRGGEICGNTTSELIYFRRGSGVYVNGGTLKISGDIKILNNSRSGVPNNIYLHTSEQMIQVEGAITSTDGAIGISTGASSASPLTVAQGNGYTLSEDDLKKFVCDAGNSLSMAENKITIPDPKPSYLIFLSYSSNGGSGFQSSSAILEGMDSNVTVASGGSLSRLNCSFTGWNTAADGSGTAYQPGDTMHLTVNTILYAQWSIHKTEFIVTAPQGGTVPTSSATCSTNGINTMLAWKLNGNSIAGNFNYNTVYSVELTLTAGSGCIFSDTPEAIVNDAPAVVQKNSNTELVVRYTFSKTDPRSAPVAVLTKTTIDVESTGSSQLLTMNVAGVAEGYNDITWTMSKAEDSGNILTLPTITTGKLSNGTLSLGNFTIAPNTTGQPSKSAKVSIVFGGNGSSDYAGVPLSLTVTLNLAAGASPNAKLDFINEKITAVSSVMEFIVTDSVVAPTDWTGATTVTETEIPIGEMIPDVGSASKYIHIRYKNITGSMPKNIEIPTRPDLVAFFGESWDSWVTDNVWTEVETGGVYEDFAYRINNDEDRINDSGNPLDILLKPGETLSFWMPATESSFKSAEIIVTAPARLAKPVVVIDFSTGKLNTTAGMEYRLSEVSDWTTCTPNIDASDFGWDDTKSVTVWLRYPCTSDNYASEAQKLMIPTTSFNAAKSAVQDASYANMTQAEAIDENTIRAALKSTAETAASSSGTAININKVSYTAPLVGTAVKPSGTNGSYTFTITVSKDGQSDTTEQKTITITATAYKGGNSGNGNNGGSDSGSGSDSPAPSGMPTKPVIGKTENKAIVTSSGTAIIRITDLNITDAIANAMTEATKNGVNAGEITVVINVSTGGENATSLTINLPKSIQKQIISNKIAGIELEIDRPDITVGIDLAAMMEINRQANADVLLTVNKIDGSKLKSAARKIIGSHPVYDFMASYQNGRRNVTNFGSGSVYVRIHMFLLKKRL